MDLGDFERMAKRWEEEIKTAGNKTTLKPHHLKKLRKHIEKIYAMHSAIAIYESKVEKWTEGV